MTVPLLVWYAALTAVFAAGMAAAVWLRSIVVAWMMAFATLLVVVAVTWLIPDDQRGSVASVLLGLSLTVLAATALEANRRRG